MALVQKWDLTGQRELQKSPCQATAPEPGLPGRKETRALSGAERGQPGSVKVDWSLT